MNSVTRKCGILLRSRSMRSPSSRALSSFVKPASWSRDMPSTYAFGNSVSRPHNFNSEFARHFSDAVPKSPLSKEHFDKLVKNNKIVVFMKGVPDEPRCGFSNAVVQILRMHGVPNYDSHNVLEDENIRTGIKEYTNWPTIPQVFINGEFVGGCDILIEMHKNGELVDHLSKVGIKSALLEDDAAEKDGKK